MSFDKQTYSQFFVNRTDIYAVQSATGAYSTHYSELTRGILFGKETVGLYQLNAENKIKWAVFDFDIAKEKSKEDPNFNFEAWKPKLQDQIRILSRVLEKEGIPHYIEFSGYRGYHVWIFFKELVDAGSVRNWLLGLKEKMEWVDSNIELEIFPKQDQIEKNDGEYGLGSLVKAPLQTHKQSGKKSFFVDRDFIEIDGLPDIKFCEVDKIKHYELERNVEKKGTGGNAKQVMAGTSGSGVNYPHPENIAKMGKYCSQLKAIVLKADTEQKLDNDDRVIVANLGRFFDEKGQEWIHDIISKTKNYDKDKTDYHINSLTGSPIKCETIRKTAQEKDPTNNLCDGCPNRWATPISFGYTKIPQHYAATQDIIEKKYLPAVFTKLGLAFTEETNFYKVEYNNSGYRISKKSGIWFGLFNVIDFVRFVRPDDWQKFMHDNFTDIVVDRFALERTQKSIGEIFEFNGEEIKFKEYISEAESKVKEILTDGNNYNVIAFTGSGKTEALINKIKNEKIKAVYLTPYESNSKQLEEKYKVPSVYGAINQKQVKDFLRSNNLIVSTYDGLSKILNCSILTEEYVLLIDEAHNLVTHSNFRSRALDLIVQNMDQFKKIINITGTPEGVLNNDFKNVKFVKENATSIISKYSILMSGQRSDEACVEHILNHKNKGKTVIFRNSIKTLETIAEGLISGGIIKEKIKILSSQEKEGKLYESIIKDEQIPGSIKYVLTTSVISDGVNILNQNISAVYMLESFDLIQHRQFLARFRKGVENVYDIILKPEKNLADLSWIDLPVELKRIITLYEMIAIEKNNYLNKMGLIKNKARTNFLYKSTGSINQELNYLRLNGLVQKVEVNIQLLTLNMLNELHKVAFNNIQKRKEYIDHFLGIESIVEETDPRHDLSAEREKVKKRAEENRKKLLSLLEKKPVDTVTAYLKRQNPVLLKDLEQRLEGLYDGTKNIEGFFQSNKELFKLKEANKLIQKYILFFKYKFTHSLIIEILSDDDAKIEEFLVGYYMQFNLYLVKNHSVILKYNKKSLSVFHYAVFKFLYDYFQSNTKFTFDELLKKTNSYLLEQKITNKRLTTNQLSGILNNLIIKKRWSERKGKKVTNRGWTFTRFKDTGDLVNGSASESAIIDTAMKSHLESKVDFMKLNLFTSALSGANDNNTELRRLLKSLENDLAELTKKM